LKSLSIEAAAVLCDSTLEALLWDSVEPVVSLHSRHA